MWFEKLARQIFLFRGAPDPDPDPAGYPVNFVDPVRIRIQKLWIRLRSGSGRIQNVWIWLGSGSGRIQNLQIRIQPDPA